MTTFTAKLFRDGEDLMFLLPPEIVSDWEIEEGGSVEWSMLDNNRAVFRIAKNGAREKTDVE